MKYIRRLLWFIASRMIILSACVAILICAFYMALNSGNIYILVTDGMAKRVEVALTREDASELNKYFSADFLNNDPVMQIAFSANSPYIDYNITDFDHVITLEWLWAWPWQDTAYCTITERVPSIEGSVISSRVNDVSGDPPTWQGGEYEVTLMKSGGQWRIVGLTQTRVILEPTPVPSATPAQEDGNAQG